MSIALWKSPVLVAFLPVEGLDAAEVNELVARLSPWFWRVEIAEAWAGVWKGNCLARPAPPL